jgi:hypothetical protein
MKAGRGTFGAARAFPIRERCLLGSSTRQALAPSDSVVRKSVGAPPLGDLFGTARTVPFDRSARRSFRPPDPRGRSGPTRKLARAPTCVNLTEGFAPQRIHRVRAGSGTENAPRQRVTRRLGGSAGSSSDADRRISAGATASYRVISAHPSRRRTSPARSPTKIRDANANPIEQTETDAKVNAPPAVFNGCHRQPRKASCDATRSVIARSIQRTSSTRRPRHRNERRSELECCEAVEHSLDRKKLVSVGEPLRSPAESRVVPARRPGDPWEVLRERGLSHSAARWFRPLYQGVQPRSMPEELPESALPRTDGAWGQGSPWRPR